MLAFSQLPGLTTFAQASENDHQIHGIISLDPQITAPRPANERLVIKFFFPDDGIEKDQTYRIFNTVTYPFEFHNGPDIDMSRRTKWPAYVVEVFTDLDGDVLSVSDAELRATTGTPVETGTTGITLSLKPVSR